MFVDCIFILKFTKLESGMDKSYYFLPSTKMIIAIVGTNKHLCNANACQLASFSQLDFGKCAQDCWGTKLVFADPNLCPLIKANGCQFKLVFAKLAIMNLMLLVTNREIPVLH